MPFHFITTMLIPSPIQYPSSDWNSFLMIFSLIQHWCSSCHDLCVQLHCDTDRHDACPEMCFILFICSMFSPSLPIFLPLGFHSLPLPEAQYARGRNLRSSPLYTRLQHAGAIFQEIMGFERPIWYDRVSGEGMTNFLLKHFLHSIVGAYNFSNDCRSFWQVL